jgi:putative nucleotidyltransferase with HDIG domain
VSPVREPKPASLPIGARAYATAVIAAGSAVIAMCAASVATTGVPKSWLLFAALTVGSGFFTLRVPSLEARLSVSEMFAFSCVLLFGPEAGALTLTTDGLIHSLRRRGTVLQSLFNGANLAISVWVSGTLFFEAAGTTPLIGAPASTGSLILPLVLLALTYFALNSGMMAVVIALASRVTPLAVWREHFLWMCPTYLAGASVALLFVVALQHVHLAVVALVPPLLFVSYLTLRSTLGRVEDARAHLDALNRLYLSTVETLASAIDAKDDVTHSHIRRVQIGAVGLARELGVTDAQMLKAVEAAALLHDTGKLAVPEHILNKPGKLTAAEYDRMKLHAPIGAEILSSIDFPYPVVPIVRHHHENWDGTGYPDGLKGSEIPIGARILAVVDCFDALTSDRPYRGRLSTDRALAILLERRGTMYDPIVVDAFLGAHERIMPTAADALHPAAKAIGEARARDEAAEPSRHPSAPEPAVTGEALAVASLARAMAGEASVSDLGALLWMLLRQLVPCEACCLFMPDGRDALVAQYSAGLPGEGLRHQRKPIGTGIAGWVAATGRPALNADPVMDLGPLTSQAGLTASLSVPLTHNGTVVAVLSAYSASPFSDDHERLLALLAPRMALAIASLPERREHPSLTSRHEAPPVRTGPDLRVVRGGLG